MGTAGQFDKCPGFIDNIDGFVRQISIIDILCGKLNGCFKGRIRVLYAVILLIIGPEAL